MQTVGKATTLLLALFLAGALVGPGTAQTARGAIVISDLPARVSAGETVAFTVTVQDEAGAPMDDYAGTVRFSASSAAAALPEDYTFGPDDAGSRVFSFTAVETGPLTIAVADARAGLRGWQRTTVAAVSAAATVRPSRDMASVAPASSPIALAPAAPAGSSVHNAAAVVNHMYVVAHQDDDLLFMNPDVEESIKAGARVRTVFTMAAGSPDSWQPREAGILNAYSVMAGVANDWTCTPKTYANKAVINCTLNPQPLVTVAFMRLPDGNLVYLWAKDNGPPFYVTPVSSLTTADNATVYTRADVANVIKALILDFAPDRLATQDSMLAYGSDHADHISSALFTLEADHAYTRAHQLRIYRDYNTDIWWDPAIPSPEVANLSAAQHDEKVRIMRAYGDPMTPGQPWDNFCWRRYVVTRLMGGTGVLAGPGGQCIGISGGEVAAVTCDDSAPRWTINGNGQIQDLGRPAGSAWAEPASTGRAEPEAYAVDPKPRRNPRVQPPLAVGRCLTVDADGSLHVGLCNAGASQGWTLTSNGQIRGQDGVCLTLGGDGVSLSAELCQPDSSTDKWRPVDAQVWVQRMGPVAGWTGQFSDGDLGSPDVYAGSFRLGDVNGDGYVDACLRMNGGLYCAVNDRSGAFGARQLYSAAFSDAAGWQGAPYGSTLQLADVNGDGKADVCGRGPSGIVCATANSDGSAMVSPRVWSTGADFSDAQGGGVSAAYYGSIRFADVNGDGYVDVCGRVSGGVMCALNDKVGHFAGATTWIADFTDAGGWQPLQYATTLQLADVNGDGRADVCVRGGSGVFCATATAANVFVDAHKWSLRTDFSDASGWGAGAAYYGSLRLADVNGDGLADLCGRGANGVVCAISNGAGFDVALAMLPHGFTDAGGWSTLSTGATLRLGDLDHDGKMDACGRGPAGLLCAKAP